MTIYYVDGVSGSDGNSGTSGSPWKTLAKANSVAAAGDTVRVRTATYYEKLTITKTNLVFENDSGHTPTIDGRYSPALFGAAGYTDADGSQIKAGELPAPTDANKNRGNWVMASAQADIVTLSGVGATCRGFIIRNVCGGGAGLTGNNALLENCRIDFTYGGSVGITGGPDRARVNNCIITRGSVKFFDASRTAGSGPAGVQTCMNIRRSTNAVVENSTVCYNYGEGINAGNDSVTPTLRYNVAHTNLHWSMGMNASKGAKIYGNVVYWCNNLVSQLGKKSIPAQIFTAADEAHGAGTSTDQQIYNNLFIGGKTTFLLGSGGGNRPITLIRGYIGYNTIVGGPLTERYVILFGVDTGDVHRNSVFENNIILKHPDAPNFIKLEAGLKQDSVVFRNNLSNQTLPGLMAGIDSIVTALNSTGLINPFATITGTFDVQSTSLPNVATSFNAANYDLQSGAAAIGRASDRSNVNGLTLPVINIDRRKNGRTDLNPSAGRYYDIGANEYNGTAPPPEDDAVVASFNRSPASGAAPLSVAFTDTSQALGAAVINQRSWDFGDGGTSTAQNPTHIYAAAGTYTTTLTVRDTVRGLESTVSGGTVTVTSTPTGDVEADYTRTPAAGQAPLSVAFTDTSTATGNGVINSWLWEFGDGGTSALQNPTHIYAAAGTYQPKLTVSDTVRGYSSGYFGPAVTVTDTPPDDALEASFTRTPASGAAPLSVAFTDTSQALGSAVINSWLWEFGDGQTSTAQHPTHVYASAGTYTPRLTIRDTTLGLVRQDGGAGRSVTVTAAPPPGAGGDVLIRQARTALNTSSGAQTFTQSSLGGVIPKSVRFIITAAVSDGTAANGELFGYGAAAGGAQWAAAIGAQHGVSGTNTARKWTDDACMLLVDGSGAEIMRATFSGWTANGVTINIVWTGAPAAYLVQVIFGAGTEYEAWVGTAGMGNSGSSTTIETGFPADLLRGVAVWGARDVATDTAALSLGLAHRLGGAYVLERYYADGAGTAQNKMRLFSGQLAHIRPGGTGRGSVTVTGWGGTGCTLSVVNDSINATMLVMAEKFGSVRSSVQLAASATATGPTDYALAFDPQYVEHLISQATALGSINNNAAGGTMGVHAVTTDGEYSAEVSGENGVTTTNEQSLSDNQMIVVGHTGTTLAAGATTLGTLKYSINYTTAPGAAMRWPALAVEEGQATGGGGDYVTAAFTSNVTSGAAPLRVEFTDLSDGTNPITSWLWNFGDGSSSIEQNPVHIYEAGGEFDVSLTVSDGTLSDTATLARWVTTMAATKRRIVVGPYLMRPITADSTPETYRDPDDALAGYMDGGLSLDYLSLNADPAAPAAASSDVRLYMDAASGDMKVKRVDDTIGTVDVT